MKIVEVAKAMGVSPQFVRIGLQTKSLPFGVAVKMSDRYTYHISEELFKKYMNGK